MASPEVKLPQEVVMAMGVASPFLALGMIFGTSRSAE
jgi:hypothetical protein